MKTTIIPAASTSLRAAHLLFAAGIRENTMTADEGVWGMSDENLPAKEIAKVANSFLNKVSKAVGAVYEPFHVTRMAKADAKAKVIRAEGEVAEVDVRRRAEQRWLHEEVRNQENIEAVTRKAIPDLRPDAKPEGMDDDWMAAFFDYAKKVSDDEMQSLWSKILSGEANAPGSFMKRVLQTVSLLEKTDAELFTTLCRFCVLLGASTPIILNTDKDSPYVKAGLTFSKLTHLEAVGLIRFDAVSGFARPGLPKNFIIGYGSKAYMAELPEGKSQITIGKVMFTEVGKQLAPLSNATVVPGFDAYFTEQWKNEGIEVTPMVVPTKVSQ